MCIAGFALQSLGVGLFTTLNAESSTSRWVAFQVIAAAGAGLVTTSILPAVQVELSESDVATSTAAWGFLRSLGSIWGVSIPAAVFNNRFEKISVLIEDEIIPKALQHGVAYEKATSKFIQRGGDQATQSAQATRLCATRGCDLC